MSASASTPAGRPAPTRRVSPLLNTAHASPEASEFFSAYFAAKTAQGVAGTMAFFSPEVATYTDAVLGWPTDGYEAVHQAFGNAMQHFGDGASYPTAILGSFPGGNGSALVAFTNTPEIVGSELHLLATADVRGGKLMRLVDYWDSSAFDDALYAKVRAPENKFPRTYKEDVVGTSASPVITEVATRLHAAIAAGDAKTAAAVFDDDALLEDMSLRVQVIGRAAIERYFGRTLRAAPLGVHSRLRHIVGGNLGGGFEWIGGPHTPVADGVTALALDAAGKIIRATTVYNGRRLGEAKRQALTLLSTAP